MEYCQYHPTSPATFYCKFCNAFTCDDCTDEGGQRAAERCFTCGNEVEHLGATYTAKPFWRRLEESFKYPMNTATIGLIVSFAFFSAVFAYLPFSWLVHLALFGGMLKYCLDSLEETAEGNLKAPDISSAYSGGIGTAVQIYVMFLLLGLLVFGAGYSGGEIIGSIVGFFVLLALPATLINYGLSRSIADAINPLNQFRLIAAIGLPYGLIVAFMMIMMASVDVLSELTGGGESFLSAFVGNAISYYYMIVLFHLMGYMVFQYQGSLGYVAREDDGEYRQPRSNLERQLAHLSILIKEGDYIAADQLFQKALVASPHDLKLNRQYFDFLLATRSVKSLSAFATPYLSFLYQTKQSDRIRNAYKHILHLLPDYIPETPACRYQVAKACHQVGEHKLTIKLINGMKKDYPDFVRLADAYELLLESLKFIPRMQAQVKKYEVLVEQLRKQQSKITREMTDQNKPVSFSSKTERSMSNDGLELVDEEKPRELPPLEFKL